MLPPGLQRSQHCFKRAKVEICTPGEQRRSTALADQPGAGPGELQVCADGAALRQAATGPDSTLSSSCHVGPTLLDTLWYVQAFAEEPGGFSGLSAAWPCSESDFGW